MQLHALLHESIRMTTFFSRNMTSCVSLSFSVSLGFLCGCAWSAPTNKSAVLPAKANSSVKTSKTSSTPQKKTPVDADSIIIPERYGVLNVRDPQFGAKGDGKTDDTAAIQKALTQALGTHRVVYIPDGVYLVTDTLKWQNAANASNNVQGWGPFLQLQGQSRNKTVIRLKSNAPGFDDPAAPRAVIQTGSSGSHGNKKYSNGEGNEAFENHLRNFTVETGKGNAGAIGIDYQASNCGAMRHVTIKGDGYCGVALTRRDNGPALLKDVSIEGFQFGIRTYQEIAHFTFEDIRLAGQSEAGIWMRDSIVAARKIVSRNTVPAIQIAGVAMLSLFDSNLSGGEAQAAIMCQGTEPRLYVRNLSTQGYEGAVRRRGKTEAKQLTEWSSDAPLGNAKGQLSLKLPIQETPQFYEADANQWADGGAPTNNDDTATLQAALNSGKSTVALRYGRYRISKTLIVPRTVKRIQGFGSSLDTAGRLPDDAPVFRVEGGKAGDLTIIDRIATGTNGGFLVEHQDTRTIVLRDIINFGSQPYRNIRGAGPLFIENVAGNGYRFAPGSQVWARQWNAEGEGGVVNDGGTVWALGTKHEGAITSFENKNGGRMEIWSALMYSFGVDKNKPFAVNENGSLALQLAGMTYMGPDGFFDLLVKDTQGSKTVELRRDVAVPRGGSVFVPLYLRVAEAKTAKP
jgi:hypothetical protein